jgi:ATPase subunit of ABC transporter with duplicated ATPase domains
MWEVHDATIDPFEGGYSAYIEQRVERDRQADVRESRRRNLARKELAWLTRGARARATKQKFHVKEARELIADVPPVRNGLELKAMATSRLGKQVVDLVDVTQEFPSSSGAEGNASGGGAGKAGKKVLDDVTWLIGPGDRFGIVGRNGAGKSTLLNIIDGSLEPTEGRVKIGKTVKFAVLSQRLEAVDALGDARVKEVLGRYKTTYIVDKKEISPAKLLERLGFESAQLMTPVCDLSGGQKRRLQLLLILLDEPNVLIMDEPGNDLDTDMLAVMEDLLDSWAGTLIVVSHDSYLLERVTDSQFALIDGKIRHLPGGVDDYFKLLATGKRNDAVAQSGQTDQQTDQQTNQYENSKRMSAIERRLEKIDGLRAGVEEKMAAVSDANGTDYEKLTQLQGEIAKLNAEQTDLEIEWDTLAELQG